MPSSPVLCPLCNFTKTVWGKKIKYTLIKKKRKVKSLSRVWLFVTPWTVAYQAPPSMGFSRQEYWSGLPFPSPGDLPNPGINVTSYPVLFPLCNFTKTVLGKKVKHTLILKTVQLSVSLRLILNLINKHWMEIEPNTYYWIL